MWSLITLIVANRIQSTEQKTQNLENKVFVGLGSCDNVLTENSILKYVNWPRLQMKRTGLSSWSVQLKNQQKESEMEGGRKELHLEFGNTHHNQTVVQIVLIHIVKLQSKSLD